MTVFCIKRAYLMEAVPFILTQNCRQLRDSSIIFGTVKCQSLWLRVRSEAKILFDYKIALLESYSDFDINLSTIFSYK